MTPAILFSSQVALDTSAQITTGPASGKQWVITTLFICNKGAITGKVSLTHGISGTDYSLLNTAELAQGETVNIGSLVMDYGNDMDVTTVDTAFDFVAYGYEDDETNLKICFLES